MSKHKVGKVDFFAECYSYRCYWCDHYYYPSEDEECPMAPTERQWAFVGLFMYIMVPIILWLLFK